MRPMAAAPSASAPTSSVLIFRSQGVEGTPVVTVEDRSTSLTVVVTNK